ncbi:MAG: hypothetical protein MZU79_05950 [Anaerotruncus sp.]|nr:hypothetical protein [Anaerotruncus sp.]
MKEYLGLGMAAHSMVSGRRFKNHVRIKPYLDAVAEIGFRLCRRRTDRFES